MFPLLHRLQLSTHLLYSCQHTSYLPCSLQLQAFYLNMCVYIYIFLLNWIKEQWKFFIFKKKKKEGHLLLILGCNTSLLILVHYPKFSGFVWICFLPYKSPSCGLEILPLKRTELYKVSVTLQLAHHLNTLVLGSLEMSEPQSYVGIIKMQNLFQQN